MPKASRPSLPTSSTDFALPPSSSNLVTSSTSSSLDDSNPLLQRFRRPSLLAPKATYLSEGRSHSPLAASFTIHSSTRRRSNHNVIAEEFESDRERMWLDSSPSSSSENPTPPLGPPENGNEDPSSKRISRRAVTPPRRAGMDSQESHSRLQSRRLSFPVRYNLSSIV
jgi:hypothetical protein